MSTIFSQESLARYESAGLLPARPNLRWAQGLGLACALSLRRPDITRTTRATGPLGASARSSRSDPAARTLDYDSVRAVAETLARQVERAHPRAVTTEWSVEARRGKVFLDYNMNCRSASLAAVYSPRAVAWAGVSTPLEWDDLENVYPAQFDILNVPQRLEQLGDLWQRILGARVDLRQLLASDS